MKTKDLPVGCAQESACQHGKISIRILSQRFFRVFMMVRRNKEPPIEKI